jgi:predicted ABC-type ATPase
MDGPENSSFDKIIRETHQNGFIVVLNFAVGHDMEH